MPSQRGEVGLGKPYGYPYPGLFGLLSVLPYRRQELRGHPPGHVEDGQRQEVGVGESHASGEDVSEVADQHGRPFDAGAEGRAIDL